MDEKAISPGGVVDVTGLTPPGSLTPEQLEKLLGWLSDPRGYTNRQVHQMAKKAGIAITEAKIGLLRHAYQEQLREGLEAKWQELLQHSVVSRFNRVQMLVEQIEETRSKLAELASADSNINNIRSMAVCQHTLVELVKALREEVGNADLGTQALSQISNPTVEMLQRLQEARRSR